MRKPQLNQCVATLTINRTETKLTAASAHPKPLVEEPTIPALPAALGGRSPFPAILRAAEMIIKGLHSTGDGVLPPGQLVCPNHPRTSSFPGMSLTEGWAAFHIKNPFLARTSTCTCWRTSPHHHASLCTLESGNASPAQPMQNTSKGF